MSDDALALSSAVSLKDAAGVRAQRIATDPSVSLRCGDVLEVLRTMPEQSVHMCVTSPPYFGLRDYSIPPSIWPDGWRGCLGLEPTIEMYLAHIVEVFREVRRVLMNDGTLWINMGDSFITNPHGAGSTHDPKYPGGRDRSEGRLRCNRTNNPSHVSPELKSKDLCMMPARVALALQADGWYLRQQIPWLKRNGMPESTTDRPVSMVEYIYLFSKSESYFYDRAAVIIQARRFVPCGPNSRMLVDRDVSHLARSGNKQRKYRAESGGNPDSASHTGYGVPWEGSSRRRRNTDWFFESWQGLFPDDNGDPLAMIVNPQRFSMEMCKQCKVCYQHKEYRKLAQVENGHRICTCGSTEWTSHFATFPEKMVRPIILAATSEHGCCAHCGAPFERVTEKPKSGDWHPGPANKHVNGAVNGTAKWAEHSAKNERVGDPLNSISKTIGAHDQLFPAPVTFGWRPTCSHPLFPIGTPKPAVVLDCFGGSGTTAVVASELGRDSILIDASADYLRMAEFRIQLAREKNRSATAARASANTTGPLLRPSPAEGRQQKEVRKKEHS